MRRRSLKLWHWVLPLGSLMYGVSLMAVPIPQYQNNSQTAPDNTKKNKEQNSPNADQQKMNSSDRTVTQKIRKSIHDDTSLSAYAHNIKIITQDGKVTLRGPVRSVEEKSNLEGKAATVAGQENVTNQLEVALPK